MITSTSSSGDRRTWIYAFAILLLVSLWMLVMRLLNSPFLVLDFEVAVVYLPTLLAGIIVLHAVKLRRNN